MGTRKMKLLFIGGKADGHRREVKEGSEDYDVPELLNESGDFKRIRYIKKRIQGENLTFFVMALQGLNGDEIFTRLLDNYKQ